MATGESDQKVSPVIEQKGVPLGCRVERSGLKASVLQDPFQHGNLLILSSAGSAIATPEVPSTQVFPLGGYAHINPFSTHDVNLSADKLLEGTEWVASYAEGHTTPKTVLRFLWAHKHSWN